MDTISSGDLEELMVEGIIDSVEALENKLSLRRYGWKCSSLIAPDSDFKKTADLKSHLTSVTLKDYYTGIADDLGYVAISHKSALQFAIARLRGAFVRSDIYKLNIEVEPIESNTEKNVRHWEVCFTVKDCIIRVANYLVTTFEVEEELPET